MFINPTIAIEEGWIVHPDCTSVSDWEHRNFISPNAIDFTLDDLRQIRQDHSFSISEDNKTHRGSNTMIPIVDRHTQLHSWTLTDTLYDGMSSMSVNIPEGIVCWLVPRSSFVRNGIFLISGLYDSGFTGSLGFVVVNLGGKSTIATGTRIGQIVFAKSESAKMYRGGYNTDVGRHWWGDQQGIQ